MRTVKETDSQRAFCISREGYSILDWEVGLKYKPRMTFGIEMPGLRIETVFWARQLT